MGVRGSDLKNLKKKRGGWVKFYSCMNVWQNFLGPSNWWNSSIFSFFVLNSLRSTSLKLLNLRFSHYWYIPTRVRTAKVFLSICLDLHLLRQLQFGPPPTACGKKCSRADRTFNTRFRWPNRFSYPDMGFLYLDAMELDTWRPDFWKCDGLKPTVLWLCLVKNWFLCWRH